MRSIELFPAGALQVAADPRRTQPTSWVRRVAAQVPGEDEPLELDVDAQYAAGKAARKAAIKAAAKRGVAVPPCTNCARWKTNLALQPPAVPMRDKDGDREAGVLLVVLSAFADGVAFVTKKLRAAGWQGLIYFDLPVRCGSDVVKPEHVDACRSFGAFTLQAVKPTHILTCGTYPSRAVLGKTVMVYATRGAWQLAELFGRKVPVVATCSTIDASTNRFYGAAFDREVAMLVRTDWDSQAPPVGTAHVVDTYADCDAFDAWRSGAQRLSIDCETEGLQFQDDFRIDSIAFARPDSNDVYVFRTSLVNAAVVWRVQRALREHRLGGANVNYDVRSIWCAWGMDISLQVDRDARLSYKTLWAGFPSDLEEMGPTIGWGQHKAEADEATADAIKELKDERQEQTGSRDFDRVRAYAIAKLPYPVGERYVARDTKVTANLIEDHDLRFQDNFLGDTYYQVALPAVRKYFRMEKRGMLIDREQLQLVDSMLTQRVAELEQKLIDDKTGIDPDKPESIRAFFEREGIKAKRLTPKADLELRARAAAAGLQAWERDKALLPTDTRSTDKRALMAIRSQHAAIADIITHRKLSKLLSANVKTIKKYIGTDSRIHPMVLQQAASTSRNSLKDPAAHGTPGRTDEGKAYKACHIASPGMKIIVWDFKALEVFLAAFTSNDPAMIGVLESGLDFHLETAKKIAPLAWGMTAEELEAEDLADQRAVPKRPRKKRDQAKTTGLATMYGIGPDALGDQIGTTRAEAAKLIDAFHTIYPRYRRWVLETEAFVVQYGYSQAVWNNRLSRTRLLFGAGYPDFTRKGSALRQGSNFPIQCSGSDYCVASGTGLDWLFERLGWDARGGLLLEVHDSIVAEVEEELVPHVVWAGQQIMTCWRIGPDGRRLRTSTEVGDSWGGASDYELPEDYVPPAWLVEEVEKIIQLLTGLT